MPPPSAGATAVCEQHTTNDARATGRGRTCVRATAHSRVGDRRARAAFRGLLDVRIIRCRSLVVSVCFAGLCSPGARRGVACRALLDGPSLIDVVALALAAGVRFSRLSLLRLGSGFALAAL